MPKISSLIFLFSLSFTIVSFGQTKVQRLQEFIDATAAVVTENDGTNGTLFLRFPGNLTGINQGSNTEQTVMNFASRYGSNLGLVNFNQNFRLMSTHIDRLGFEHQIYEQYIDGVEGDVTIQRLYPRDFWLIKKTQENIPQ